MQKKKKKFNWGMRGENGVLRKKSSNRIQAPAPPVIFPSEGTDSSRRLATVLKH